MIEYGDVSMETKVIFINLTKLCNVNCPRCYLSEENRAKKDFLPPEYLRKICDSSFIQDAEDVVFVFQGGEPSVLGSVRLNAYADIIEGMVNDPKIAMVSNLLNMPEWLIDFSKNRLLGRLETTYASGHKFTLAGSENDYNFRFERSLKKAIESGLPCPINVELNRETFEKGPEYLVNLASRTNARIWEFDFSVDFGSFLRAPGFNIFNYPVVSSTIQYHEFYDFVFRFAELFREKIGDGLSCGVVDQYQKGNESINFNIQREKDFITINPDGSITTNPLFSDIVATYLGNISEKSLDQIVESNSRYRRILHEKHRVVQCMSCEWFERCGGGVSHLSVNDGGRTCIGGKEYWSLINE